MQYVWIYTHPHLGVCINPEVRPVEAVYNLWLDRWVPGAGVPNLYGWWSGWQGGPMAVSAAKCMEPELSGARRYAFEQPREYGGEPRRALTAEPVAQ